MRKGFISLVKLEDFATGQIFPHEQTLAKPKEDRLKLTKSCNANFSQVFTFYEDADSRVSEILQNVCEGKPETDFIDCYGIRNSLWAIRDKDDNDKISLLMNDKPLFIADGHHRYETALFYRDLAREDDRAKGP